VRPGDDLVDLLLEVASPADGDVVAVTSKVVSKAEGRLRSGAREDALADETERVVARRGRTVIVRTRQGLTLAAAGIDASNVEQGSILLLPVDPDASARRLRTGLRGRTGRNVGVVITDTAGRAWREGQTDIAVGAAGLNVLESFAGQEDAYGNPLAVTAPAVADELAGMAELAQGKLGGRPFAVVRGRPDLVLPAGQHGPGAAALVRPDGADLFGYGAREAVLRALRGDPQDQPAFGAPASADDLTAALHAALGEDAEVRTEPGQHDGSPGPTLTCTVRGPRLPLVAALAFAHGWSVIGTPGDTPDASAVGLRPVTP
jgi:coenzyme F420-0:L-glutamate ligase/coenzyme F420-1:gamma-L-glutamate ligase